MPIGLNKGDKEGGEAHMAVLSEPLVPVLDFMATEKKLWERNGGTCETHSKSTALKINIKIIFFYSKS